MNVETSCTDCTRIITIEADVAEKRAKKSRLCEGCRDIRDTHNFDPDKLSPRHNHGDYRISVELQWSITGRDLEYRCPGDTEVDFAQRSLESVRSHLQLIAGCGYRVTPIAHYHLLDKSPSRCFSNGDNLERPDGPIRQYHDALNQCATVLADLFRQMSTPKGDIFKTLAIGYRLGWPVSEKIEEFVRAAETNDMPISSEVARQRLVEEGVI